jgi:hypothetical protein
MRSRMKAEPKIRKEYRDAKRGRYRGQSDDWNEAYQIALEFVLDYEGPSVQHTVEKNERQRKRWDALDKKEAKKR